MSYQYTDKQLNIFNRKANVYSVNPDLAKEKRHKHVTDKDGKLGVNETNEIKIGDQEFRVVSTLNDDGTGDQAMAVVVAGTTPTDSKDLVGAGVSWQSQTDFASAILGRYLAT